MQIPQRMLGLLAVMAVGTAPALATAAGFSEDFENFAALTGNGWVLTNASSSPGQSWFAGNAGVFEAQAGSAGSYAAANFLSTNAANGSISNWLITPQIVVSAGDTLSFYARSETLDFSDGLNVLLSPSGSSATASFSVSLLSVGAAPDSWTQYSLVLPDLGGPTAVRIAFEYFSPDAIDANFIGLDSVAVTPIPEPTTAILLGLGLAGLMIRRRLAA